MWRTHRISRNDSESCDEEDDATADRVQSLADTS
jgi:hypothetical protein